MGERLRGAIVLAYRPQKEFLRGRPHGSLGRFAGEDGQPTGPRRSSATAHGAADGAAARAQRRGCAAAWCDGARHRAGPGQSRNGARRRADGGTRGGAVEHAGASGAGGRAAAAAHGTSGCASRADRDGYNVHRRICRAPIRASRRNGPGRRASGFVAHRPPARPTTPTVSVAVMEAMRILTKLGGRPRRTVRVALWSGEEQGVIGSGALCHEEPGRRGARAGASRCTSNDDPGTGPSYGFYMQENEAAQAQSSTAGSSRCATSVCAAT